MRWTLGLGTLFGIRVRLHVSFLLLLAWVLYVGYTTVDPLYGNTDDFESIRHDPAVPAPHFVPGDDRSVEREKTLGVIERVGPPTQLSTVTNEPLQNLCVHRVSLVHGAKLRDRVLRLPEVVHRHRVDEAVACHIGCE